MKNNRLILCIGLLVIISTACNRGSKSLVSSTTTANSKGDVKQTTSSNSTTSSETKKSETNTHTKNASVLAPGGYPLAPAFPGGNLAMNDFIENNIQYPAAAKTAHVNGKVEVAFTVKITGELINIKIKQGLGYGCDEEALRIVKLMPNWEPAQNLDKKHEMDYSVSIPFIQK
jgi:protein TonB